MPPYLLLGLRWRQWRLQVWLFATVWEGRSSGRQALPGDLYARLCVVPLTPGPGRSGELPRPTHDLERARTADAWLDERCTVWATSEPDLRAALRPGALEALHALVALLTTGVPRFRAATLTLGGDRMMLRVGTLLPPLPVLLQIQGHLRRLQDELWR